MRHSDPGAGAIRIRRALLSVSDKTGIGALAAALEKSGAEVVATGKTADLIRAAGVAVTPIESITGNPEAFQGRMKTLSFPVCSGILYRRGDASDERDLAELKVPAIDCVVVNFYPFEANPGIEQIDIGGPTLVRSAAKNAEHVLCVTDPAQYEALISELRETGAVCLNTRKRCAARAWERMAEYDEAIRRVYGERRQTTLRYGENPHQRATLEFDPEGPIAWPAHADEALTPNELSYNNILDLSSAYALASDLKRLNPDAQGVVVVKHNNPCGVALVPAQAGNPQLRALELAWAGDPVSAFGGVLVFTHELQLPTARWLAKNFVEAVAAPGLGTGPSKEALQELLAARKKLKAVAIRRFGDEPREVVAAVPGGLLRQTADVGLVDTTLTPKTRKTFTDAQQAAAPFGIAVCRALKSNAIALVRRLSDGSFQLVGAGQGQPNRVEALEKLALPRAAGVLEAAEGGDRGTLQDLVMVSDAFFPFRDTVDTAAAHGIRAIVQPGGSLKDQDSIVAAEEHGVAMVFTGIRHFRH